MIQQLTKVESATRQLAAAIRMYFQDTDPLAIHTIAGAVHRLLQDLMKRNAGRSAKSAMTPAQQSERAELVSSMTREAINFLKHADRDPCGLLIFNTDWTDFLLFDAIQLHLSLTHELPRESTFFLMWVTAKYPTVRLLDDLTDSRIEELRRVFPMLGGTDTQKRTFLVALESSPRPKIPDEQHPNRAGT